MPRSQSVIQEYVGRQFGKGRRWGRNKSRTDVAESRAASHGPLPIVIGITGHRDLRSIDISALESLVREEFQRLQDAYPSTSFIVLSALADGADRLGARLALDAGFRLVVPLPMPQRIYEQDFSETSTGEFRSLLSRAEHHFTLAVPHNTSDDDLHCPGHARDHQFAQLGAYLAMHSEVLIALWDGVHRNLPGGTSQIVKFKLEGVPEPYAPPHSELDAPDSGPVYHIVTPRESNPEALLAALTSRRLYPKGFGTAEEAEQAYSDIYERMETMNRDALLYAAELGEHRRQSKEYLLPHKQQRHLRAMLREVLEFYSIADVLSQRFQKRTHATLKVLLACVFLAAAAYDVYGHYYAEQPWMLTLYPVAFSLAFASYYWAARSGYQTKYLDYRALAEGLRVQFFWKLAGLGDSVADFYMRKQKSELDWIRNAIRSTLTERCADKPGSEAHEHAMRSTEREELSLVMKHWVEDQARYFGKSAHRDHAKLYKHERSITWLFAGTLLLACIQLAVPYNRNIMLTIGLLPVIAAVIHTYMQKNALAEQTKQYDRMSVLFHRALVHVESLIETGEATHVKNFLAELGREALAENGDWILMHRDRPLEVPKGA